MPVLAVNAGAISEKTSVRLAAAATVSFWGCSAVRGVTQELSSAVMQSIGPLSRALMLCYVNITLLFLRTILIWTFASIVCFCQAGRAELFGTIHDPSGLAVSKA